jgi:hypothetical protein
MEATARNGPYVDGLNEPSAEAQAFPWSFQSREVVKTAQTDERPPRGTLFDER